MATAKLVAPQMDKGWSLQFFDCDSALRGRVIGGVMDTNKIVGCRAFLQGDSDGWLMVEFWTDDEDAILRGAEHLSDIAGVPIN